MTLAVGNEVVHTVNGGFMAEPALFGVVDLITGTLPDLVRVCFENGSTQFFNSTNEALVGLQIVTEINTDIGKRKRATGLGNAEVYVMRTWTYSGTEYALVRTVGVMESAGRPLVPTMYAIVATTTLKEPQ